MIAIRVITQTTRQLRRSRHYSPNDLQNTTDRFTLLESLKGVGAGVNQVDADDREFPERKRQRDGESPPRELSGGHSPSAARRTSNLMAIYAFARMTDDIGDEASGDRLALLDWLDDELDLAFRGEAIHPVFQRLTATISSLNLDPNLFVP